MAANFPVARNPVWAPDGGGLLFLGRRDRESPITESFDIWYVPLAGGEPRRTGILDVNQWRGAMIQERTTFGDWTPAGLLVASGASLWSVPLSPDGRVTGAPGQLLLGAGVYRHPRSAAPLDRVRRPVDECLIQRGARQRRSSPVNLFADGGWPHVE